MKILLVDDEKEFVSALAERLGMRGFSVEWSSNGEDALAKVARGDFDLAILDLKMPSISGQELQQKMMGLSPRLKFMFITGHGSMGDFAQCMQGAECCIGKPLDLEVLIDKIRNLEAKALDKSDDRTQGAV